MWFAYWARSLNDCFLGFNVTRHLSHSTINSQHRTSYTWDINGPVIQKKRQAQVGGQPRLNCDHREEKKKKGIAEKLSHSIKLKAR